MMAHLKTIAKWIDQHHAFTLGNPMAKIKLPDLVPLVINKALTEKERRQLLDAVDWCTEKADFSSRAIYVFSSLHLSTIFNSV